VGSDLAQIEVWPSEAHYKRGLKSDAMGRLAFFGKCTYDVTCASHPGCRHMVSFWKMPVAEAGQRSNLHNSSMDLIESASKVDPHPSKSTCVGFW
jgi:hypothetical protein